MLLAGPAIRRSSVRSVATAAKAKVSVDSSSANTPPPELQHRTELPPDRAAALARSKWAAKPKPSDQASSQAGPSTPAPTVARPSTPMQPFRSFVAEPPAKTTMWDLSTPTIAQTPGEKWAAQLSATTKWARREHLTTASPDPPSFEELVSADDLQIKPDKSSGRTRWPPLSTSPPSTSKRDAWRVAGEKTSWNERLEPAWTNTRSAESRTGPRSNVPPQTTNSPLTEQWTLPQPSQPPKLPAHLRWQPPDPPPAALRDSIPVSPSESSKGLAAPPHSVLDTLLPPKALSPDSQLQRDVAPHLAPRPPGKLSHPDHQLQAQSLRFVAPQSAAKTALPRRPEKTAAVPGLLLPLSAPTPEVHVTEKNARPKNTFKERGSLLNADTYQLATQEKPYGPKAKRPWAYVEKRVTEDVYIPSTVSVGHLARLLSVRLEELQNKMFQAGMGEQASFDYVLTSDYAVLLAEEFGRKPIVNDEAAFDLYPPPPHPDPASLPSRPPVVTIMGHVDHGKTTLLDTLRSASVAQGEVGGITQHIGAFSVPVPSGTGAGGPQSITFLDTPGHAAFSAMRARGAQVTDIIVLVVAADDGIMPQTREVIELIKKDREKIGVVVAINKIDKPGCDVDALHKALLVEDIHVEELGGDTPAVEVSGLTGKGLPDLVETLSLIAEIQDLRAERDGMVFGYVLESKVVKGLGPIATVLILRGSLFPGSHVVSGVHHAKVRIMQDSNGKSVKSASPGMAVTVSGWKSLPSAGDEVLQGTESEIKKAIANRQRKADIEVSLRDIEAINSSRQQERERRQAEEEAETAGDAAQLTPKEEVLTGPKELRLLIKADVSGSAEAVEGALQGIGNHLAVTKIISSGVGDIMESDVMMAKAVGGTIVGFSVLSNRTVDSLAGQHNVPIITSDIIYRLMEDVKARVIKMLPVIIESRVIGEAKVLQIFDIQVKGKQTKKVAGSRVINGLIEKNKLARVMRGGDIVHEGSFDTMRHFKKDVTEIRKGNECGLNLADFDDLQVDDIIQTYETVEKPGVL